MAIYFAGYLSPVRNKLGNAVGRKWRTLDVLAVYNGRPRNPRTNSQQIVRSRFASAASTARAFDSAVKIGFKPICDGTPIPERSMFIKKNWEHFTCDTPGSVTVEWSSLVISEGSFAAPVLANATFTNPLEVDVAQTETTSAEGALATDIVRLFVYAPEANAGILGEAEDRATSTLKVMVPSQMVGLRVHVWGFCYGASGSANAGKVSNSLYLGSGSIQ